MVYLQVREFYYEQKLPGCYNIFFKHVDFYASPRLPKIPLKARSEIVLTRRKIEFKI